jgi:hypothetical membrane protein
MATHALHGSQVRQAREAHGTGLRTDASRLAGATFIGIGAGFLTGIMVAASIAPGYDYNTAAISDLGVIDETAALFNVLLVAVGVLNIVGGVLFGRAHGRDWLVALYVVAGIGAIGAGLLPLSTGAPHSLFALVGFLFFNLEAIGTAAVLAGPLRWLSVAAGAIGVVYVVVMVIGDAGSAGAFGPIGHGGSERMIVYPAMLWLLVLGGHLLGGHVLGGERSAGGARAADLS